MNYFALLYDLVDDMVTRRVPFREEHLRLAREAYQRGELALAGALEDPVDRALLVFHVADKSQVEAFARRDPYVVNGLVKKREVRPWNVVVGDEKPPTIAAPASGTILRRWFARTSEALLPKYLDHFSKTVAPELRRVEGYLGATVSTRRTSSEAEIVVETSWRSIDSIRNFAGPDLEAAVVAPEAAALLTDFDRRVHHYEIAISC
jgi:uncharacterized protein YciI/heme-degrading monooxygenase HmoA